MFSLCPPSWEGGVEPPFQLTGGLPHPIQSNGGGGIEGTGRVPPSKPGEGYSHLRMGVPPSGWMGVSPPLWGLMDTPPPPRETEQHSEYLLCGGQNASCVHAGWRFCLLNFHDLNRKRSFFNVLKCDHSILFSVNIYNVPKCERSLLLSVDISSSEMEVQLFVFNWHFWCPEMGTQILLLDDIFDVLKWERSFFFINLLKWKHYKTSYVGTNDYVVLEKANFSLKQATSNADF